MPHNGSRCSLLKDTIIKQVRQNLDHFFASYGYSFNAKESFYYRKQEFEVQFLHLNITRYGKEYRITLSLALRHERIEQFLDRYDKSIVPWKYSATAILNGINKSIIPQTGLEYETQPDWYISEEFEISPVCISIQEYFVQFAVGWLKYYSDLNLLFEDLINLPKPYRFSSVNARSKAAAIAVCQNDHNKMQQLRTIMKVKPSHDDFVVNDLLKSGDPP